MPATHVWPRASLPPHVHGLPSAPEWPTNALSLVLRRAGAASHDSAVRLGGLPPIYRDLDMAEVQPQVLDGMRQAAALHAVARRIPADSGQLLGGLACQPRLRAAQ